MVILGNALSPMSIDEQLDNSAALGAIRVDELDHYEEAWIPPFALRDGVRIKTKEKFSDYYELFEEIGQGKFGKVFRCVEKRTKLTLAAKSIRLKKDSDIQKVEKEVKIMTRMRHKCIAQIYDAFVTSSNDVILVMEIVEGGELFDRVEEDSYILTEMAVAMIVYQILEAIRYIHSQNIIHLDLKPENIMCVSKTSNEIKLIDFGLAQYYDGQSDLLFMAGTPEFAAPEVIRYEPLSFHTDMWSLGVITYILLSGVSPFLGETTAHTYCNVEKAKWDFCEEFAENGISEEAKNFISKLLIFEKEKRMLPDDCLRHPWIVQCKQRASASRSATPVTMPNIEKPIDATKLRKYIRNKRFRRLVFGVMFINSVVRMMKMLQANKSTHGIEYVRNMLKAANETKTTDSDNNSTTNNNDNIKNKTGPQSSPNLLLKAFTKKRDKPAEIGKKFAETGINVKPSTSQQRQQQFQPNVASNSATKTTTKMAVSMSTATTTTAAKTPASDTSKRKTTVRESQDQNNIIKVSVFESASSSEPDKNHHEKKKVRTAVETKKRSKSASRKNDSQRTRSSTEQTSKKRQKTDALDLEKSHHLRTASVSPVGRAIFPPSVGSKSPMLKRSVKFDEKLVSSGDKTISSTNNAFQLPVFVCVTKPPEETEKVSTSKQKSKEETATLNGPGGTPNKTLRPVRIDCSLSIEKKESLLLMPKITTKAESKNEKVEDDGEKNKVSYLLGKFEERRNKSASPVSFATVAIPPKEQHPSGMKRSKSKMELRTENKIPATPEMSKTILCELERKRFEQNYCSKVTEKQRTKETTMNKIVGKEIRKLSNTKISENEVVCGMNKKILTTESSSLPKEKIIIENSAKASFKPKVAGVQLVSSSGKSEKNIEHIERLKIERDKMANGVQTLKEKLVLKKSNNERAKSDVENESIEVQRHNLRKIHVKNNEQSEQVTKENAKKVMVKRVKKRSKKSTLSVDGDSIDKSIRRGKRPSALLKEKENGLQPDMASIEESSKLVAACSKINAQTACSSVSRWAHAETQGQTALSMEASECGGWGTVGQDVFDFSLLRKKLQNRILGMKDEEDLATEEENRSKCEMRVKLGANLNAKHAMRKWISMDKEQQQGHQSVKVK